MAKTPSLNASVRSVLTVPPFLRCRSSRALSEAYATGEATVIHQPNG